MKLSLDWLNDYVDLRDVSPQEIAQAITLSIAEVEAVIPIGKELESVVVGEVLSVEKVPDSKLHLTRVAIGSGEPLQIVCGATNVRQGMKIAVAQIGTLLPGASEPIKHVKLKKIDSYGMICSEVELGLGENSDGIMDLEATLKMPLTAGESLPKVMGIRDTLFEIENKTITHRPDLWGHYGFARELACIYQRKLKPLYTKKEWEEIQKLPSQIPLKIQIQERTLCPRYSAMVFSDCEIKPSSRNIQNRLRAVGMRPINNIVDITNYIMLDIGQPLHAFDRKWVKNDEIWVRKAKPGEKFVTLDQKERDLDETMLLIADSRSGIALAGVMGGQSSEISEKTREVILESANFDPINVRKTSSKLALRTESSMRFEKSLDPENTTPGVLLAYRYFQKEGLKPLTGLVDSGYTPKKITIPIQYDFINRRLGTQLAESEITRMLTGLEFHLEGSKGKYTLTVPSFRATKDISIPEDIVEEIGRIHGFTQIPEQLPPIQSKNYQAESWRPLCRNLQESLSLSLGYHEVSNYSFCDLEMSQKLVGSAIFKQWEDDQKFVRLKNPLGQENDRLRIDLLPSLFKNVLANFNRDSSVFLYEVGRTYHPEPDPEGLVTEIRHITGIKAVKAKDERLFFRVKGDLIVALKHAGFTQVSVVPVTKTPFPYYHTRRSAQIQIGKIGVGHLFQLKPKLLLNFEITGSLVAFDLEIPKILEAQSQHPPKRFQKLPEYPPTILDLALLVPEITPIAEVQNEMVQGNSKGWLRKVELFDIYRNAEKYPNQKSLAFTLEYRSDSNSLTGAQVEKEIKKLIQGIEQKGWKLRT
ncbi:MAG: phenylalanine--tRNA ligase subunit beta [Planctomycetota bacterium]